ncbi:MAG: hypothetical protein WAW23_12910 [Candidatus Methanoperedens sp.]
MVVGIVLKVFSHLYGKVKRIYEKKSVSASLLSEIKTNQNKLQPLAKALNNIETSEEDKFPNGLAFESRIYSASLGKLGLLDNNERDKLVTYYSEFKHIEEEYNGLKLEMIHGFPIQNLAYFEISRITNCKWDEIEEFLVNTKKVYGLGEELIKDLNDDVGIKPISEGEVSLTTRNLRIDRPDIRKIWSESEELKTRISKDKKRIKEHIENEYGGLPPDFELELRPDKKKRRIYNLLEEFYRGGKISEDGKIKNSKEFVETIIKDKSLCEIFRTVFKNEDDLYEKTNELERLFEKIVPDFEKRHNELKDWYGELDSLK